MKQLGIVTALAPEAAIAGRDRASAPIVHCAGPGAERAGRAARALLAEGSEALLSFGVAGGLDPGLAPGTVVVSDRVIGPDRSFLVADDGWRERLIGTGHEREPMKIGHVASADRPLRKPDQKASLFAETGAAAVDLESFAVARVAHDAGIPFLAVRAIADPAWRIVPDAAMRALRTDGRLNPLGALGGLVAKPWEAWDFARLAWDGRAAFAALRRVASLGAGFGIV